MNAGQLYRYCYLAGHAFLPLWLRHLWYRLTKGQNVVAGRYVSFVGVPPSVYGRLMIGVDNWILSLPESATLIKNSGEFLCKGICDIHRGCRIEIGNDAKLILNNCFINNNCLIICLHGISMGENTSIGWNTQILDEDFHDIIRENSDVSRKETKQINIGSHVLIGNNCFIYKGVTIADGCVVASNSVVKKSLFKPNTLYAGNPVKEICKIYNWTS